MRNCRCRCMELQMHGDARIAAGSLVDIKRDSRFVFLIAYIGVIRAVLRKKMRTSELVGGLLFMQSVSSVPCKPVQ